MTVLLAVRHGEADGNSHHRFIGQTDAHLTDQGRAQAELLALRLVKLPISRIISSDLRRTIDTVTPTANALGLPVEKDPRLREILNGDWTGLLPDDIANAWPEVWTAYRSGEDVLRPGGESWAHVRERVLSVVEELPVDDSVVLFSTHGGPSLCLAQWAIGIEPGRNIFRGPLAAVENTGLVAIDLRGPRLLAFNDLGHLGDRLPSLPLPFDS
ncbi:histidine phosphatase family protein [soil metagenome]